MPYGRAPVDYFKTWPDKAYFFSSSRASVVAYGVAWSVAVSLGDPVGPVDELAPLILSFVSFCAGNGWRAAFQEVLPDLLPVYQRHGFSVLKIGEEGLVDLERFATHTSRQRAFRKPRQHLEAAGYRVTREFGLIPKAASTRRRRCRTNGFRCRGAVSGPSRSVDSIAATSRSGHWSSSGIRSDDSPPS
jgi:hypothetical protein